MISIGSSIAIVSIKVAPKTHRDDNRDETQSPESIPTRMEFLWIFLTQGTTI